MKVVAILRGLGVIFGVAAMIQIYVGIWFPSVEAGVSGFVTGMFAVAFFGVASYINYTKENS